MGPLTIPDLVNMSLARVNYFIQTTKHPKFVPLLQSKNCGRIHLPRNIFDKNSTFIGGFIVWSTASHWGSKSPMGNYAIDMALYFDNKVDYFPTQYKLNKVIVPDYEVGHIDLFVHNFELLYPEWEKTYAKH